MELLPLKIVRNGLFINLYEKLIIKVSTAWKIIYLCIW